jgi:hypothetical protein
MGRECGWRWRGSAGWRGGKVASTEQQTLIREQEAAGLRLDELILFRVTTPRGARFGGLQVHLAPFPQVVNPYYVLSVCYRILFFSHLRFLIGGV